MTRFDRPLEGTPGELAPVVLPRWFVEIRPAGGLGRKELSGALDFGRVRLHQADESVRVLPFGPERGSLALFEGYLFDRAELARELEIPPDRATEVRILTAAYRKWGAELFEHLDGAYIGLIWDGETRTLLAGRDPLGHHPLYWTRTGDSLWVGSNVLALVDSGRIPKRPDRVSLALRLLSRWPRAGETFFDGVRRLSPGCLLRWRGSGEPEVTEFWNGIPDDDEPCIDDARVLEEFEPRLARSVGRCLQLRPDGVMLSGGIDSVTIASLAVEQARQLDLVDLTAVSATAPPGYEADAGTPYQRPVAERLGMAHLVSDVRDWLGERDWWEVYLEEALRLPSPTVIWWTGEFMGFYRWTSCRGVHTLLTGSGADDWLNVPYVHLADLLRGLRFGEIARFFRAVHSSGGGSRAHLLDGLWQRGLLPYANAVWEKLAPSSRARRHRRSWKGRLPDWWCPDRALFEEVLGYLETLRLPGLDARGRLPRSQYRHALRHAVRNPFGSYESERSFHENSLAGVRLLAPFHDRRMAEFFYRMSPGVRLHGGRSKGLLRPIVARRLPGLGLESQRKDYPVESRNRSQICLRRHLPAAWREIDFGPLFDLGLADRATLPSSIENVASWDIYDLVRLTPVATTPLWLEAQRL